MMTPAATYEHITVRPIAGALGAEISGVDLRDLSDAAFAEIRKAWLEHLVVFLRDQDITPKEQIAFAKRFGDIHLHQFMKNMDDYPEILEIIKAEADTRSFGSTWHSDQMFNPKPAMATILYARETRAAGGDTLFANGYLAYEKLSDGMKKMAEGLRAWNVGDRNKLTTYDRHGSMTKGSYDGNPET